MSSFKGFGGIIVTEQPGLKRDKEIGSSSRHERDVV